MNKCYQPPTRCNICRRELNPDIRVTVSSVTGKMIKCAISHSVCSPICAAEAAKQLFTSDRGSEYCYETDGHGNKNVLVDTRSEKDKETWGELSRQMDEELLKNLPEGGLEDEDS